MVLPLLVNEVDPLIVTVDLAIHQCGQNALEIFQLTKKVGCFVFFCCQVTQESVGSPAPSAMSQAYSLPHRVTFSLRYNEVAINLPCTVVLISVQWVSLLYLFVAMQ